MLKKLLVSAHNILASPEICAGKVYTRKSNAYTAGNLSQVGRGQLMRMSLETEITMATDGLLPHGVSDQLSTLQLFMETWIPESS
jgi:hypothetical protein